MCYLFIFKIKVAWHLYCLFNPRIISLHNSSLLSVYWLLILYCPGLSYRGIGLQLILGLITLACVSSPYSFLSSRKIDTEQTRKTKCLYPFGLESKTWITICTISCNLICCSMIIIVI